MSKVVPFPLKSTAEKDLAKARNADEQFFHDLNTNERFQWMVLPARHALEMMVRIGEFKPEEAHGITGLFMTKDVSPEHSVLILFGRTDGRIRHPFLILQRYQAPTVESIKRAEGLNEKVLAKLQSYINSWDATQKDRQPLIQAAAPVFFFAWFSGLGATLVKHSIPEKHIKAAKGSLTFSLDSDPGWLYELGFCFDAVDNV